MLWQLLEQKLACWYSDLIAMLSQQHWSMSQVKEKTAHHKNKIPRLLK